MEHIQILMFMINRVEIKRHMIAYGIREKMLAQGGQLLQQVLDTIPDEYHNSRLYQYIFNRRKQSLSDRTQYRIVRFMKRITSGLRT